MNTSKVYFTNLRTTPSSNLLDKMERLVKRAGIANIDFKNQFVAIKIHFGEPGNLAYIRPNYAARLVSLLRELGAKPFLTDCNTLYSGRRSNAVDHLQSAMENGFNPMSAGCNVIIADGVKGTDYREDRDRRAILQGPENRCRYRRCRYHHFHEPFQRSRASRFRRCAEKPRDGMRQRRR